MINLQMQDEPARFDQEVRTPGKAFLAEVPNPTSKQFDQHAYWTRVGYDAYVTYKRICSYTCHYIAPDTGSRHIDHFLPKSRYPTLAYEWSNYRLACGLLNTRKWTTLILDPFTIENGWFVIEFPSLLVKPSAALSQSDRTAVKRTIDRLKLNDELTCMQARTAYVRDYCLGHIDFPHLRTHAPFLGMELERQNLVTMIKAIMRF